MIHSPFSFVGGVKFSVVGANISLVFTAGLKPASSLAQKTNFIFSIFLSAGQAICFEIRENPS